jgi:hypothetical protein
LNRIPEIAQYSQLKLASNLWSKYSKYTLKPHIPLEIVNSDGFGGVGGPGEVNIGENVDSLAQKLVKLQHYEHKLYLNCLPQLLCTGFGGEKNANAEILGEFDFFKKDEKKV